VSEEVVRHAAVRPGNSVETAYREIRDAIICGDYPPGSPLRLQALAANHAVSFIPVREALRMLEAEGLIETVPNKGARVAPLSLVAIEDGYSTRIALEINALQRGIDRLTPEIIGRGKALIPKMVKAFKAGDSHAYELHRELHFTLYEASESRWLMQMIGMLWDHTDRYRRLSIPLNRDVDALGDEHEAIFAAVAAGDVDAAVGALTDHLSHTLAMLRAKISESTTAAGTPELSALP
jgi:DNA-binding GntR family transcriptional regulator